MNSPKATRVRLSIAKKVELLDLFRKGRPRTETVKNCFRKAGWKKNDEKNGNFSLDDEKDEIPLAILRSRLQLPESMTFEDYVNIDSNVQTDEEEEQVLIASAKGRNGTESPYTT